MKTCTRLVNLFLLCSFVVLGVSNTAFSLSEENFVRLNSVSSFDDSAELFAKTFADVAEEEEESVEQILSELQEENPDFVLNLFENKDVFKLAFLLDRGWNLKTPTSRGANLLVTALSYEDVTLVEMVLRTIKHQLQTAYEKQLAEENHPETLVDIEQRIEKGQSAEDRIEKEFAELLKEQVSAYLVNVPDFERSWMTKHFSAWSEGSLERVSRLEEGELKVENLQKRMDVAMMPMVEQGNIFESTPEPSSPPRKFGGAPTTSEDFESNGFLRGGGEERSQGYTIVKVPYGTNRKFDSSITPNTPDHSARYYSYSELGRISFGKAYVSIPGSHQIGESGDRAIWEFSEDPEKHIMLQKITRQSEQEFFSEIAQTFDERRSRFEDQPDVNNDVFIFIHGFNNDFRQAMIKTAQLMYDMKFPGVALAYSWPARPVRVPLPWDFRADVDRANNSVQYLTDFLVKVKENFSDKQIHVIAHSLGTRVLSKALLEVAEIIKSRGIEGVSDGTHILGEVILAAPAIDAQTFVRDWAHQITPLCERVSILASDDDVALKTQTLAEDSHFSFPLGLWSDEQAALPPDIDTFDISNLSSGLISLDHSTYSQTAPAINHMARLIKEDPVRNLADPSQNEHLRVQYFNGLRYLEELFRRGTITGQVSRFWKFR